MLCLLIELIEEANKLGKGLLFQLRKLSQQNSPEIVLGNDGHADDQEAGAQGLIQFPGARIAVVHGADKAAHGVYRQPLIARHINDPPEIQHTVQHRQRLILRHVDLIQYRKAAVPGRQPHRPRLEHHPAAVKAVCSDEIGGIHAHVKGNIPGRPAEEGRQILTKHILASGLGAGQQQILSCQQSRQRCIPDLCPVIGAVRPGNPGCQSFAHRIVLPQRLYLLQQVLRHTVSPQGRKKSLRFHCHAPPASLPLHAGQSHRSIWYCHIIDTLPPETWA